MKKSDLKSGMIFKTYDSDEWRVCVSNIFNEDEPCYFNYSDGKYNTLGNLGELKIVAKCATLGILMYGFLNSENINSLSGFKILWQRQPEKTFELDGVEYSESTLRSLIKKANKDD